MAFFLNHGRHWPSQDYASGDAGNNAEQLVLNSFLSLVPKLACSLIILLIQLKGGLRKHVNKWSLRAKILANEQNNPIIIKR
jgi:hypothetical protein